jgi:DnaJ-class molecular chaperone
MDYSNNHPAPTIESLQLDGFKVVICETCQGWGKVPCRNYYTSYEYHEETCSTCKGTGRQISKTTTSSKPFELPTGSKQ